MKASSPIPSEEILIDGREVQRRLCISRATFYRLVKPGPMDPVTKKPGPPKLPFRRLNLPGSAPYRFSLADVERLILQPGGGR